MICLLSIVLLGIDHQLQRLGVVIFIGDYSQIDNFLFCFLLLFVDYLQIALGLMVFLLNRELNQIFVAVYRLLVLVL